MTNMGVWWVLEKPTFFLLPSHCWLTIELLFSLQLLFFCSLCWLINSLSFPFFSFSGLLFQLLMTLSLWRRLAFGFPSGKMTIPLVISIFREWCPWQHFDWIICRSLFRNYKQCWRISFEIRSFFTMLSCSSVTGISWKSRISQLSCFTFTN